MTRAPTSSATLLARSVSAAARVGRPGSTAASSRASTARATAATSSTSASIGAQLVARQAPHDHAGEVDPGQVGRRVVGAAVARPPASGPGASPLAQSTRRIDDGAVGHAPRRPAARGPRRAAAAAGGRRRTRAPTRRGTSRGSAPPAPPPRPPRRPPAPAARARAAARPSAGARSNESTSTTAPGWSAAPASARSKLTRDGLEGAGVERPHDAARAPWPAARPRGAARSCRCRRARGPARPGSCAAARQQLVDPAQQAAPAAEARGVDRRQVIAEPVRPPRHRPSLPARPRRPSRGFETDSILTGPGAVRTVSVEAEAADDRSRADGHLQGSEADEGRRGGRARRCSSRRSSCRRRSCSSNRPLRRRRRRHRPRGRGVPAGGIGAGITPAPAPGAVERRRSSSPIGGVSIELYAELSRELGARGATIEQAPAVGRRAGHRRRRLARGRRRVEPADGREPGGGARVQPPLSGRG